MILTHESDHVEVAPPSSRRRAMLVVLVLMAAVIAATVAVAVRTVYPDAFVFPGFGGSPVQRFELPPAAELAPEKLTVAQDALKPVSAEQAADINAKVPVVEGPNPSASALLVPLGDGQSFTRSLDCMTAAIYYEAAREPVDGQRAVAQVILNRVRHPAYPHSVCGVVFQGSTRKTGCQFSFTCDGSLARAPMQSLWTQARGVASAALAGYVYAPVGWSTHYHANYVVPYWASSLLKTATIGAHIFYRWEGGWGRPGAFTAQYAGAEPSGLLADARLLAQAPAEGLPQAATPFAGVRTVLAQDAPTAEAAALLPVARNRWVLTDGSESQPQVAADTGKSPEKPRSVSLSTVKAPVGVPAKAAETKAND